MNDERIETSVSSLRTCVFSFLLWSDFVALDIVALVAVFVKYQQT
jgi:hypothetical protein